MNKKIKKLVYEVNGFYKDCCEDDSICFEPKDLEKFVELLLQESISVMKENDYHGEWLGEKLLEHFQVDKRSIALNRMYENEKQLGLDW